MPSNYSFLLKMQSDWLLQFVWLVSTNQVALLWLLYSEIIAFYFKSLNFIIQNSKELPDLNGLIKKEISSTSRHLRGTWLAYWEHEIGKDGKTGKACLCFLIKYYSRYLCKWLWLSWYSVRYRYQRSAVWIQSLAKIYYYWTIIVYYQLCIEKTKNKEKEAGNGAFKKKFAKQK